MTVRSTIDCKQVFYLYWKGLSDKEISIELNCSRQGVRRIRLKRKLAVNANRRKRWTADEEAKLLQWVVEGEKYSEIGRRLNRTVGSITRKIIDLKFTWVSRQQKPDTQKKIFELREKGMSLRKIAAHLGVNLSVVCYHVYKEKNNVQSL